jgi:hypothetical protein
MKKTNKKPIDELSTVDQTLASLTPKQRKKFDQEMEDFALEEMLLAIMEQDKTSVRQLAKISGVSPTIIQAMRSGAKKDYSLTVFLKVLKGLGCKHFKIERNGRYLNIPIQIELPKTIKKIKK